MLAGTLFDRYKVLSTSEDDGMSRARCRDAKADRDIEIIGIPKEMMAHPTTGYTTAMLVEDVRRACATTHPGILQAQELMQDQDRIYVISEIPDGLPIAKLPKANAGVPPNFVIGAMVRLLSLFELLQRIGQHGLCLTPADVYLSPKGVLKVENIAAARILHVARAISRKDGTGSLLGSFGAFREDGICRADDCERAADLLDVLATIPAQSEIIPHIGKITTALRADKFNQTAIVEAQEKMRYLSSALSGKPRLTAAKPAPGAVRRNFRPGEYLFRQGDLGNGECYVLDEGLVQISKTTEDGREVYLDLSRPGDIIGEMAVLDDQPRMASAQVLEPSSASVIQGVEFLKRLERSDVIAMRLIEIMAKRIRYQAGEIARLKSIIGNKG